MSQPEAISTDQAPVAVGPYTQAVRAGMLIFTAGQIGMVPASGQMAGDDPVAQAEQIMRNLSAVLQAAGSDLAHVLKTTIFLTDMGHFAAVNEVYGRAFAAHKPARSTVAVKELPLGALLEIEAVALVREP